MAIRFMRVGPIVTFSFHELGNRGCGHFRSHGRVTAVYGPASARNKRGVAGAEKQYALGHLFRLADASQQRARGANAVGLLLVAVGQPFHVPGPSPALGAGITPYPDSR